MHLAPETVTWNTDLNMAVDHVSMIDIWKIPVVNLSDNENNTIDLILSDDERRRFVKIQSETARSVFFSSKLYLRHILARYTGLKPGELLLSQQPSGKPYIQNSEIEFNLTHSGRLILLAVCKNRALGIDVEKKRIISNWQGIAKKVFSDEQQQRLFNASDPAYEFSDYWTQFEALQKMNGKGVFGEKPLAGLARLHRFTPQQGYTACLAFEQTPEHPETRFFDAGALSPPGHS